MSPWGWIYNIGRQKRPNKVQAIMAICTFFVLIYSALVVANAGAVMLDKEIKNDKETVDSEIPALPIIEDKGLIEELDILSQLE